MTIPQTHHRGRVETSASLTSFLIRSKNMDREFFEQFTLEQILAISEFVEAMLDSQQASHDSQE